MQIGGIKLICSGILTVFNRNSLKDGYQRAFNLLYYVLKQGVKNTHILTGMFLVTGQFQRFQNAQRAS